MTDYERRRNKAASEYRDEDFRNNPRGYTVSYHVNSDTTSNAFIAGADWARDEWHDMGPLKEKLRIATTALEVYAMTNETFPEYGTVAKEALEKIK